MITEMSEKTAQNLSLPVDFVESYKNFPVPWGPIGYVSYKRTYARPIVPEFLQHIDSYHEQLKQWRKMTGDSDAHFKTEEWWQTTARCVNWYLGAAKGAVSVEEGMALYDDIMNLRCSFSGRGMWQCGTKTVERLGQNSLNNCYFVNIDSIDSFLFTFDMLMLGGGVGFNIQKEFVYELPKIKRGKVLRKESNDADFIVPDSREGWVDLLRRVLNVYFNTGASFSFSTVCIRPAGSPIAGFGGVASGPEPLCQGITQITNILDGRAGKKLRPIDCLDILNIIGSIVVAGNVRRSAEVAIGDHEDTYFLEAKRFDLPTPIPNWRSMSNNSVACSHYTYLSDKFWKTYEVGGEPYGLVNLKLCREKGRLKDNHRKDPNVTGVNPCAEITLESGESCNLAEIFYPNITSKQQLLEVAERIWKVCKVVACVPHSWELANKVISKNLRTGQGLTGVFQKNTAQIAEWSDAAYKHLEKVDVAFSKELTAVYGRKINTSIKLTTVKPSGCRPVNALTTTSQGILMLDEIFENHEEEAEWSDCSDISVVRPDGTFPVSKTYVNGTTEVLGINLGYGVQLQSTANHQWFVKQRYERNSAHRFVDVNSWCRADELKSGDVIDFALGLYTNEQNTKLRKVNMQSVRMRNDGSIIKQPETMTPDLAWLIGYLWGDGAQSPGKWRIRLSDERRDNIDKACRIVREQFGLEGSIEQSSDRSDISLTFASVELWHWLLGQGVWKYYTDDSLNFIPKCVRASSREVILAFFAGLFDADGCASKKNEDSRGFSLSTAYSEFSRHLQGVLLAVGIVTGRSYNKPTDTHFSDRGMYLMSISEPLSDPVSIDIVARHSNKLSKFFLNNPKSVAPQKITKHFGRVESVVSLGLMPTYDFEVPEGHHYYDTAFKSHNTLSLLAGVSPGLHPEYSSFYIRRIRMASNSPIVDACRKAGYPVEPVIRFDGTRDLGTAVVEFPVKAREGAVVAKEVTAISQLEMAKMLQTNWSDNSVSVTVYYRKEELPEIKQWLSENYDTGVKTVSFLLHSEHGFIQAPYEEITEKEYERRAKNLKPLDLSGSHDEMYDTSDCGGGACPVK